MPAVRGAIGGRDADDMLKTSPAQFVREVRQELAKVTWPPRKELLTATGVVIVAVIIAGVYIGVFDFIWNLIVRAVGLG